MGSNPHKLKWIKELRDDKIVEVEYISGIHNPAGILTKVLTAYKHRVILNSIQQMWLSRVKYGEYTAKAFLHHCKVHVSRFQIKKIPLKSDKK